MIVQNAAISLKMPKKLKEKIIQEAETQQIPLSEYLRRMIWNEVYVPNKPAR